MWQVFICNRFLSLVNLPDLARPSRPGVWFQQVADSSGDGGGSPEICEIVPTLLGKRTQHGDGGDQIVVLIISVSLRNFPGDLFLFCIYYKSLSFLKQKF